MFASLGRDLGFKGREDSVSAYWFDLSEVGGEGGVCVSDALEDADLVCGVATVGDEFEVAGKNSDSAD